MPLYDTLRPRLKTGDLALFAGTGTASRLIQRATGSHCSHIGLLLVLDDPGHDAVLLLESTTLSDLPDLRSGTPRRGVQLVPLSERLRRYRGEVFLRPLSRPLTPSMQRRLARRRRQLGGRPYERDRLELIRAAYDGAFGQNREALRSVFCSELVAELYQAAGLLHEPPVGPPSNEYTPGDFADDAVSPLKLAHPGFTLLPEIPVLI